jgi:hypothetical protein
MYHFVMCVIVDCFFIIFSIYCFCKQRMMKDEQKFNQSRTMFLIGTINGVLIILKALLNLFLFASSFGLNLENRYSVNFIFLKAKIIRRGVQSLILDLFPTLLMIAIVFWFPVKVENREHLTLIQIQ